MNTPMQRTPSRRSGFTLIELMIVVVLLGLIGTMLTGVLVRQQRFHRAVASVTDARARMRDIQTILPTDMRSISSAGKDILAISDTSMQFRAFLGSSVLCRYATVDEIELPPQIMTPTAPANSAVTRPTVLTSWISAPGINDVVFIYNDSIAAGNVDDSWTRFRITDTVSVTTDSYCPSTANPTFTVAADVGKRRYKLKLDGNPNQAQIKFGAPMRFAREVRYSIYRASDNQWYVGYQTCAANATPTLPGACGTREVLAGPVLPATASVGTSGLFFTFYNKSGVQMTALSATDTIARISVVVRTMSESLRRATSTQITSFTGGDSLHFSVGVRNRI